MYGLAQALAGLARRLGVQIRCGQGVQRLVLHQGRVAGVQLAAGAGRPADTLPAQSVVFNGDAQALADGLLGDAVRPAVRPLAPAKRSLSALTWNLRTPVGGFPLLRHTVFFSSDYPREFDELFRQRRLPTEPTVYICAQDRGDTAPPAGGLPQPERLLCLVNAPATGDAGAPDDEEMDACEQRTFAHLSRLGLQLDPQSPGRLRHGPSTWAQRFPATGGALYGRATHGWQASFSRPPSATPVPGLVLAGGSTHPGAGVPMAALSGLLAAETVLQQQPGRTSISTWRPAVMPGGTSMP
jgi:1-hydroxycarotenoid 3,4-desaturase